MPRRIKAVLKAKEGPLSTSKVYLIKWPVSVYIYISAVKLLITINHIQNKSFCLHNTCVRTVYIYYVYINTHTSMYIYLRKICYISILICISI